ncbi:hypothetical protein OROMI_002102 [Orobanche minor]
MGSFRENCEIIEAEDEQSTSRLRPHTLRQVRSHDQEQKPPFPKKEYNRTLEDDINKLFEAVNLRSSKSLDISDMRRNPSKKPMRGNGSNSPGIGFSEPVSLKQALRGLCISQAAEMAALKRSSMPASPRISEAGKNSSFYRSPLESRERKVEMLLMPEENTASSSHMVPRAAQDFVVKSTLATKNSSSSPRFSVIPLVEKLEYNSREFSRPLTECSDVQISLVEGDIAKCSAKKQAPCPREPIVPNEITNVSAEIDVQLVGKGLHKENRNLVPSSPNDKVRYSFPNEKKKLSGSNKVASVSSQKPNTPLKVVDRVAPKLRRKSRLQTVSSSSSVVKGNKDGKKSTRATRRAVKPVIINKNIIIRKPRKVAVSKDGNSKTSYKANSVHEEHPGPLLCQKCRCSLSKDTSSVVKNNVNTKPGEKGDMYQSSKSSICGFSSSTTSLSDESNLSGSTCGNRPHMSKDTRWEAISRLRKQYGFLGLSHFNLLKKLGSGDIGTVYLAQLIGTNCPYAIKVMDNEFLAKRKKMPRAQTEREILRMLDHPFLPTLYAQFTSDNLSCLVMEFCPGGDLHVLRQKQSGRYFPEDAARFYVAEVLLALEYLHMLGIVYRDLKPENILVREDGHIMLTDFDLSLRCSVNPTLIRSSPELPRISGPCTGSNCIDPFCSGPSCKMSCFSPRLLHSTARAKKLKAEAAAQAQARSLPQLVAEPTEARSNSFVGTHEYLAPEIIKGEGHGSAVDWWTFGVFLYELLYGRTPFKGADNEETLANVAVQNLKFPDTPIVSLRARDLIRGLLVKEPENRLGKEMGAAEIKRHPFFEGLNWALIRCGSPPQIPEVYDVEGLRMGFEGEGKRYLNCGVRGEQLEFELF